MKLSDQELIFIRNTLLARRMYANTAIPLGEAVWKSYMNDLLQKIEDELYTATNV